VNRPHARGFRQENSAQLRAWPVARSLLASVGEENCPRPRQVTFWQARLSEGA